MWCWAGTLLAIRANDTNQAWLCSLWKWKNSFTPINNILSVLIFFHSLLFFVLFESVCFMSVYLHSSKGLQYKQHIYIYIFASKKYIIQLITRFYNHDKRAECVNGPSVCMYVYGRNCVIRSSQPMVICIDIQLARSQYTCKAFIHRNIHESIHTSPPSSFYALLDGHFVYWIAFRTEHCMVY